MFNMQALKKHYALVPVVVICGGACAMCAAYIGYMAYSKQDFSFRLNSGGGQMRPYQAMDPTEVRKLMNVHRLDPTKFDPEVQALKREIGSFHAENK